MSTRDRILPIAREFKSALRDLYGERLEDVIVFGSWARGTAFEDSDIDILVILRGPIVPGREIDRMIDIITDINLKYGVLISVVPTTPEAYSGERSPLFINIQKEGISA